MTPLRAYVYSSDARGEWSVEVVRDLEPLREVWHQRPQPASIVIHVGFWRPESAAFSELVERNPGRVLLTSSAKFSLENSVRLQHRQLGMPEARQSISR